MNDQVSTISSGTIKQIYSGWDWYKGNDLYLIGEIGDGSCFYHSICDSLLHVYQNNNELIKFFKEKISEIYEEKKYTSSELKKYKQIFVDSFRRGIAKMIISEDQEVTEEIVIKRIKLANINFYLTHYLKDKNNKIYEDMPISFFTNFFNKFYILAEEDIIDEIVDKCILKDNGENISKNNINDIFLKMQIKYNNKMISMEQSSINYILTDIKKSIMEEVDDDEKENIDKHFQKYIDKAYKHIEDSLVTFLTACKIYKNGKVISSFKWVEEKLINLFNIIKNSIIKLKYTFGNKEKYTYGNISKKDIPEINNYEELESFIFPIPKEKKVRSLSPQFQRSSDGNRRRSLSYSDIRNQEERKYISNYLNNTGESFTYSDYKKMINSDPRDDFLTNLDKDDLLFKVSLKLNYFKLMNYTIIEKVNLNEMSFHLKNLIYTINSKEIQNDREDASWNDIITIMPEILGINIHILEVYKDYIKVYRTIPEEKELNSANIVLRGDGVHFEVIGCLDDNGNIQTMFENSHPFIEAIRFYNLYIMEGIIKPEIYFSQEEIKKRKDNSFFP